MDEATGCNPVEVIPPRRFESYSLPQSVARSRFNGLDCFLGTVSSRFIERAAMNLEATSPTAEAYGSNPFQCRFESDVAHQMRASSNGKTSGFHPLNAGSIPVTRSNFLRLGFWDKQILQISVAGFDSLPGRQFYVRDGPGRAF